jgi:hypothetical protein
MEITHMCHHFFWHSSESDVVWEFAKFKKHHQSAVRNQDGGGSAGL